MSMKFAGFMAAMREDRLAKEDREFKEAMMNKEFEQKLKIADLTRYQEQAVKDKALQKEIDLAMEITGFPPSARSDMARYVEGYGLDGVTKMYRENKLKYNGSGVSRTGSGSGGATWDGAMSENATHAYNYFIEKGESPIMAAGIVGNLMQESKTILDPYTVGDNGNSWGIAQMNGTRRKAMDAWARENGRSVWDIDTQLDWMYAELEQEPHEKAAWERARAAQTPEQAAAILSNEYWRPSDPKVENRKNYATKVYTSMMDDLEGSQSPVVTAAISDTTPEQPWGNYNLGEPVPAPGEESAAPTVSTQGSTSTDTDTQTEAAFGFGASTEQRRSGLYIEPDKAEDTSNYNDINEKIGDINNNNDAIAVEEMINGDQTLSKGQKGRLLERVQRMRTGFNDEEQRAKNAGDVKGPEWFSTELQGATTIDKLDSLLFAVDASPSFDEDPDGRREMKAQIYQRIRLKEERDLNEARANGEWRTYAPFAADGSLSGTGSKQVKWVRDHWEDSSGAVVNMDQGRVLPLEGIDEAYKRHNTVINDVGEYLAGAVNGANTILNLRQSVIENPASVNKYVQAFAGISNEVYNAIKGIRAIDGKFHLKDMEAGLTDVFSKMGAESANIAAQQLYAAYALAAVNGSSGQALSDKELEKNLSAVGFGLGSADKVVSRLNQAFNEQILQAGELQRAARVNNLVLDPAVADALSKTPMFMDFRDYVRAEISRIQPERGARMFQEAVEGKTDYDYVQNVNDGRYGTEEPGSTAQPTQPGTPAEGVSRVSAPKTVTPEMVAKYPELAGKEGQQVRARVTGGEVTFEDAE